MTLTEIKEIIVFCKEQGILHFKNNHVEFSLSSKVVEEKPILEVQAQTRNEKKSPEEIEQIMSQLMIEDPEAYEELLQKGFEKDA